MSKWTLAGCRERVRQHDPDELGDYSKLADLEGLIDDRAQLLALVDQAFNARAALLEYVEEFRKAQGNPAKTAELVVMFLINARPLLREHP